MADDTTSDDAPTRVATAQCHRSREELGRDKMNYINKMYIYIQNRQGYHWVVEVTVHA